MQARHSKKRCERTRSRYLKVLSQTSFEDEEHGALVAIRSVASPVQAEDDEQGGQDLVIALTDHRDSCLV